MTISIETPTSYPLKYYTLIEGHKRLKKKCHSYTVDTLNPTLPFVRFIFFLLLNLLSVLSYQFGVQKS